MSPPVSTGETGPKNDWPTAVHVSAAKLGTIHAGLQRERAEREHRGQEQRQRVRAGP